MASGTQVRRVLLQIQADEGDTEAKLDAIAAKAEELSKLHPELSVNIDKAAALAKMRVLRDELNVAAKAKPIEPEVKPKADEPAAVEAGVKAADGVNKGFRLRMSWVAVGWSSLIGVSLAALPALAADAGALAGAALAAKLLIGTSQVKGPLYAEWTELSKGLMSVLRTSTLPLLQPLSQAFEQIGQWARAIKPELTAAFASIGPLIAPLVRGLESVVSGLLPGFITLMRAAQPAVQAVSSLLGGLSRDLGGMLAGLAPAVRASSVVLGALGALVHALLPVVTSLAQSLAGALGPALGAIARVFAVLVPPVSRILGLLVQLGGSVLTALAGGLAQILSPAAQLVGVLLNGLEPILKSLQGNIARLAGTLASQLAQSLQQLLPAAVPVINAMMTLLQRVIIPLLPQVVTLVGDLIQTQRAVTPLAGAVLGLAGVLANLGNRVIVPLMPMITQLTGYLVQMANAAVQALNAVSSVLSLFGVHLGGGGGGLGGPGLAFPGVSLPPGAGSAAFSAGSSYGAGIGGAWAQGVTAGTMAAVKPPAANLALLLAQGLQQHLAGTAAQVQSATSQLISVVTTDEAAGIISRSRGSALQMWLQEDGNRLESLATRRATILARIVVAEKYAASVATTIRNQDTLGSAAAGGWNGGPQTTRQIIGNLQVDVQKINAFARNIAKLRKMRLNPTYLDQLIQMGPDAGGQLAEQLANSGIGDIRQINSAESAIYRASGQLGKTAADAMYDNGKNAGKGFLSGLESQQKAIEKLMQSIAKTMVDTIKRELGIHSPSTVARQLAREFPNGLMLGLEDGHSGVMTASGRLARAMVPQHGTAGAGGYGAGVGRIEINLTGGDREFRTWLKKQIRITGGNVAVIGA